ncbi:MAG: tetraacyldisaccharide 4'-kinase [Phycisphaerales bacterium]|nr:tetraacyldisaccharide 4'-kinase [Phycisphaerales bacterium]
MTRGDPPSHPASPLPAPLAPALGPLLSSLYRLEINRRNRRFDHGDGITRFDLPVISIGNLSTGGTGKTPMVARIVSWLIDAGHHPVIAMRGYKAAGDSRGDECDQYLRTLPPRPDGSPIPVIAQPDRIAGLRSLLASPTGSGIDRIILDDGFQHRRIARDLDIVLIDATRSPFNDRLLPHGWLREPVESLKRAHAIVLTHTQSTDPRAADHILEQARALNPAALLALTRHTWRSLQIAGTPHDLSYLKDKPTLALCAIGNPTPFLETARRTTDVIAQIVLPDHDPYSPRTIDRIISTANSSRAQFILATEKDWSKLRHIDPSRFPCPLARPTLDIEFTQGEQELRAQCLMPDA